MVTWFAQWLSQTPEHHPWFHNLPPPSTSRPFVKFIISLISEAIILLHGTVSHLPHCYSRLPDGLVSIFHLAAWSKRLFSGFHGSLNQMQTSYPSLQAYVIRPLAISYQTSSCTAPHPCRLSPHWPPFMVSSMPIPSSFRAFSYTALYFPDSFYGPHTPSRSLLKCHLLREVFPDYLNRRLLINLNTLYLVSCIALATINNFFVFIVCLPL